MLASCLNLIDGFQQAWNDPQRIDSPALADENRALNYGELYAAVSQFAGQLHQAGIRYADRVALAIDRSATLAVAILGTMAAGACPCPLEPKLGAAEAQRRTRVGGITWLLFDSAHADDARNSGLPDERCLDLASLPPSAPYWTTRIEPASDSFLLFTSGSSGKPKGVLQNHRGMLANAAGIIERTGLGPSDRLLHIMPLHHTNGINNQLLAPLLAGSAVIVANRFKADNMPDLLARFKPTIVTGVPTMYARMLPLTFSSESLSSLRMLRCGSAPITEELHRRIEAKFALPLVVSYGLSEATCTSTMNPPQARKLGSVGTPLQGQSVFLRGPAGQALRAAGGEGEICIAGPTLMTGYLQEGDAGMAQPVGDMVRTGDLGRFDPDGYLFITGRLKDVIIRGGENLSPTLIEEAIATVPGVAACCVVGKAHADLGEVPVAFVVRQHNEAGTNLEPAAINAVVASQLSRIHQPAQCFFVASLPENATGKVDRKKLREQLAAAT